MNGLFCQTCTRQRQIEAAWIIKCKWARDVALKEAADTSVIGSHVLFVSVVCVSLYEEGKCADLDAACVCD